MLRHATLALAFLLAPASALAEIAIGTAGPMDGPFAVFGEELKNGAAQAVADINARGGVLGEPLRLEAGDDKCDGETATAIANQMVGKGIALMAGHFCSFASIPASLVYNQAKVVQITPASPHPKFTDQRPGPGIFRICGRDDQQGAVAGAFIASRFADRNVAVIDDKSAYGKGLADRTRTAMNGAGKKELFTDSYDPGSKDFSELVSRLKAASVGLVFIAGFPSDVAAIAREMKAQAVSATIMGGDTLMTDEYWQAAGDAAEGTLVTFPPDARRSPRAEGVVTEFRDAGIEPDGYTLCTYAAVEVWAAAAKAAGSIDFDKVVPAIAAGSFDTVIGTVRFDRKGDSTLPGYVVYVWHDGKYVPLAM
jgi:branched-chain amino acid transport system substrate-binding protein